MEALAFEAELEERDLLCVFSRVSARAWFLFGLNSVACFFLIPTDIVFNWSHQHLCPAQMFECTTSPGRHWLNRGRLRLRDSWNAAEKKRLEVSVCNVRPTPASAVQVSCQRVNVRPFPRAPLIRMLSNSASTLEITRASVRYSLGFVCTVRVPAFRLMCGAVRNTCHRFANPSAPFDL